jgi:beta-carotene 3-hydroxylase
LIISGNEFALPVGLGIAVYGVLYFIVHDLFTHRRFLPFKSKNKIILNVRAAHQKHHQSIDKAGNEPFGLFLTSKGFFKDNS